MFSSESIRNENSEKDCMRGFLKSSNLSFFLLNATQFLVALNDNIFKLLVIYLLINVKGALAAPTVLSLVGAIFVIPFLLFSSGAGVLADKISKRTIIVFAKSLEVVIMGFGLVAVWFQSEWAAYLSLFFLSSEAAIFGPSKYGIIPELVEPKMVSKANASITSFTYLAIILGTFLASFLTDVTNKNFVFVSAFCLFVAVIGLFTSLGIQKTASQNSTKRINPFFLYEIYQALKLSRKVPHLVCAIFGSSFFLFIGAFTQLNIIPFAMQSLHLSEVGGGYLFLPTAVGIAIGAILSGQLSKDKVEPGISCISGFFIGILFLLLHFFASSLIMAIILLTLLGVFGGAFLIPFDSFIQVNSPDEKRGQVIATSNFFSFVGVLLASFCLYLISEEIGFSASSGFALMGILSIFASIGLSGRLSSLFFPFFVRKILKRFRTLKVLPPMPDPSAIIVLQSNSWWDAILLFSLFPKLMILLPTKRYRRLTWFNRWADSIHLIPAMPEKKDLKIFDRENLPTFCLFLHKRDDSQKILEAYEPFFRNNGMSMVFAHGKKQRLQRRYRLIRYTHKLITVYFKN
jgi:acyl-[acyl-carrier-protein]-phospholipid O-acyltransferase/long-chain-fatty-acid--[acyl-carrier-protein] ligase